MTTSMAMTPELTRRNNQTRYLEAADTIFSILALPRLQREQQEKGEPDIITGEQEANILRFGEEQLENILWARGVLREVRSPSVKHYDFAPGEMTDVMECLKAGLGCIAVSESGGQRV